MRAAADGTKGEATITGPGTARGPSVLPLAGGWNDAYRFVRNVGTTDKR